MRTEYSFDKTHTARFSGRMRFMEESRFPLNLMLWIDRSHDGRDKIFAAEVFDGQPLYLGRGDCLYPADVLFLSLIHI